MLTTGSRGMHVAVALAALMMGTTSCNGSTAGAAQPGSSNAADTAAATENAAPSEASPAPVAPTPVAAATPADQDWSGRYTYELSDGANAAGTGVTVTYTLTLTPSSCQLQAEGYQTDETILCATKPVANGIDITFKSYGDGRTTDKYDNQVYSVGDPLFTLQRQGGKVLTRWKGYPLADGKPHDTGVYFQR